MTEPRSNSDQGPSGVSAAIWAGFIASALAVILGAISFVTIDYHRRFADAVHIADSELSSASSHLENLLATTEAMMDSASSILADADLSKLQTWLAKLISGNGIAVQLGVVDLNGRFMASNIAVPTTPIDLSDREHIKVHLNGLTQGIFISEPLVGRVSNTRTIQVSKITAIPGNDRAAILVASLDVTALTRELATHSGDSIFVVSRLNGGSLFATHPDADICSTPALLIAWRQPADWYPMSCIMRSNALPRLAITVGIRKPIATAMGDWPIVAGLTMTGAFLIVAILFSSAAFAARIQNIRQREARLLADNELVKRTRDLYADILQHNSAYVIVLDEGGAVVFANERTNRDLKEYIIGDRCNLAALTGNGSFSRSDDVPARHAVRTTDGTLRQIAWSISKIEHDGAPTLVAYGIDRTQLDDLNSAVLHQLKLIDLGQIASTLIHEMKQPISAIEFALPVALKKIDETSPARGPLAIVERALARMKSLNEKSRAYGQRSARCEEAVLVRNACADASALLKYQLRQANAKLLIDVPDHLCAYCDPTYLSQIIVIVLRNAIEAIISDQQSNYEPIIKVMASSLGADVDILIADNGRGISPTIIDRLFTPYFTTKTRTGGMGLGLSVARTLLGEMLGSISVIPSEKGALFQIRLPAAVTQSDEMYPTTIVAPQEMAAKPDAISSPNNW